MSETLFFALFLAGLALVLRLIQKKQEAAARQRQIALAAKLKAWRDAWQHEIDRSKWIPRGTAARIAAAYPHPTNASSVLSDLEAEFDRHNRDHLKRKKTELSPFFARLESNPLTDEQVNACICMDDHVQIVAAAGSGKTSTMVAKAGYTLKDGLATGDQLLLLAFNADAARELGERCQQKLTALPGADLITAKTFHAFSLDVIAKATGKKPRLARWLAQPGGDIKMMSEIIADLCRNDPRFCDDWHFFRTIYGRDPGQWNVPDPSDAYGNGRRGFRTANGEIVKSKQERLIADWLFYNQVTYEYERVYEHETADETHGQYHPDFYYPDINLYHEHFALDAGGNPPDHFEPGYLEGVAWKRRLHADKGTSLFETTSHQIAKGAALPRLRETLIQSGLTPKFDPDRVAPGSQPVATDEIARTLRIFQQHAKSNSLSPTQICSALQSQPRTANADRLRRFVAIYERVADEWERRLEAENAVDFENMILQAADHIEAGRFASPYRMVLSDEFQDSSRARIRLLKALTKRRGQPVHLCVVGDDWQGINRFAGADIHVMTEFDQIFTEATRLTLNTTFRCPQQICDVSSAFIQQNPVQIRKTVTTTNRYRAKNYLLAYSFEDEEVASRHLTDQLAQMQGYVQTGRLEAGANGKIKVLLLGRYRNDEPMLLPAWQGLYHDVLDIDFKTIHSSKGLEADYVMLVNLTEGTRGFPSQIEDDPVLQIPMPTPDPFPMAEERRLFYVALTRARRQIRIYTSTSRPSRFVVELVKAGACTIQTIGGDALEPCPRCKLGVLMVRSGPYGKFTSCSTFPRCDWKATWSISTPRQPPEPPSIARWT